jgi:hypothetical protein
MAPLLDLLSTFISLAFLSILGLIAGVAIPGLFLGAVAPWLDRLRPVSDKQP